MNPAKSERPRVLMLETLERRQLFCGSMTSSLPTSAAIATPAVVVHPNFTPVLETYAGDLLTGSTLDGAPATAQFKLQLKTYSASTGKLSGILNVENLLVEGHSLGNFAVPFSVAAHFTTAGGFDMHITGHGFDIKLKGDYKRNSTFISGTSNGTYKTGGTSYAISFNFDLSQRS